MIKLKNWKHFIDCCKYYDYIIISGPQRSGTTYVAKELAFELEYDYIDEFKHGIARFKKMLSFIENKPKVIQAPALSHKLHKITNEKTLVVFMMRNNHDISLSEDRIGWHDKHANTEFAKYKESFPERIERINDFKRSAPMKKWIWKRCQKKEMQIDYLELPFEFISQSKGYVVKEERVNFKKKQTK